jgi:hypothetical protein
MQRLGRSPRFTAAAQRSQPRLHYFLAHRRGRGVIFLSTLMHGLAHARQIVSAADQGEMRKSLREIADQAL